MRPVCVKCGTIAKSGKISCCGRGGSWFSNCGGAGNAKLGHAWHDGIQACKARSQSKRTNSGQSNTPQQLKFSYGADTENVDETLKTINALGFTAANAFMNKSAIMPAGKSMQYDAEITNLKVIANITSSNSAMTNALTSAAAAHTTTLATTVLIIITSAIGTAITMTQTMKKGGNLNWLDFKA